MATSAELTTLAQRAQTWDGPTLRIAIEEIERTFANNNGDVKDDAAQRLGVLYAERSRRLEVAAQNPVLLEGITITANAPNGVNFAVVAFALVLLTGAIILAVQIAGR